MHEVVRHGRSRSRRATAAAQRADELLAEGDMEGRVVWHRIERAIDELRKSAPGDDERVH